jgi:Phage integrase, N-terminal SAM-like domain
MPSAALNEAHGALQRGLYLEPSKLTVRASCGITGCRPSNPDCARAPSSYRSVIRTHIEPQLGDMRLQALTPDELNAFYGRLLRTGRAPSTSGRSQRSRRRGFDLLAPEPGRAAARVRKTPRVASKTVGGGGGDPLDRLLLQPVATRRSAARACRPSGRRHARSSLLARQPSGSESLARCARRSCPPRRRGSVRTRVSSRWDAEP